jgi:hypothetical protein
VTFSLNEVEGLAKKATRGAGYPWGVAEDTSKAVRFLCAHGLDGCGSLARLLQHFDGRPMEQRSADIGGGTWSSPGGLLCPLMAGTALSDRATTVLDAQIEIGPMVEPLLLIPFAHLVARSTDTCLSVSWGDALVRMDGTSLEVQGQIPHRAETVRVFKGGEITIPCTAQTRASPDLSDWDCLNSFAHRTYAPATEESRRKGAG